MMKFFADRRPQTSGSGMPTAGELGANALRLICGFGKVIGKMNCGIEPWRARLAVMLSCALWCTAGALADERERNWPQWRGPLGTGVAPHADPPLHWSESATGTENVRWKTALPGLGHSAPIVWRDRIFVTTAVPFGKARSPRMSGAPGAHDNLPITHKHRFLLLAISRDDGRVLWQRALAEALPHEGAHRSGSLASHSPVTDGTHVYAFFGSYGLFCVDFDGETKWHKQLGLMHTKHGHGEGSSPVLHGDTIIVNWDHEGASFIVALDKRSGEQRWRRDREEVTSWATPVTAEVDGRAQVIVSGTARIRGYDLKSGETVWECGGLSNNVVASPVVGNGIVVAASSYDTRNMLAIRLAGAAGDVTGSEHVLWSRRHRTPYVPSPLLYDGSLYFLRHYQGILTRVHLATGEEPDGPYRLGGLFDIYASPIGAGGRIYVTGRNGETLVLEHDRHGVAPLTELARNTLDDDISASAAVVDRELFLRGEHFLYCISEDK